MPEGVIVGGWAYTIAAYLITAAVFAGYTWSLVARQRRLDREETRA